MKALVLRCALATAAVLLASVAAAAPQVAGTPLEKQALVFGQHIRYIEAGAGPAIVLVHGLADDSGV